jgi:glycosyltransferase involved in cell wall biosynthesis
VIADLLMGGAQTGLVRLIDLDFLSPPRTHLLVLGRADPAILRAVLDRGPWAGVMLLERGPAPWRWAMGSLALGRLLVRLRPHLVVLSLEPANLVGRMLRPFFPRPVFCSFEHSSRCRRLVYRMLFPLLSRGIDAVLYDSPATRAGVERFYGSRSRQWLEVPLFVFDPTVPAKRDYAIGSVARILSVGRLVPAKDQALLLRVVAELRRRGCAVTCEIVGEGPLRPALERLAVELGLSADVRLTGQDATWQQRAWEFDLYLQTSEHEGACLTVLEAMAAGLPVVATAVGEIPSHLAGGAGLVVSDRDPLAVADAVEGLLCDETARAALGRTARAKVQHFYTFAELRARLQGAVAHLLAAKRQSLVNRVTRIGT